jgi:Fe-S-cluster containining protein
MDPFYERAAFEEFKQAVDDLSRSSDVEGCTLDSYRRYDLLMAGLADTIPLKVDCTVGCSYCCHFKVEVKAYELFVILRYLRKALPQHEIHGVLTSAESNAERIRQLSREQHFGTNLACPFLKDDRCRIYPVRPYACRNFHATNRYNCMVSYENPSDQSVPNTFIPELHGAGHGHKFGYEKALAAKGYDMRVYDMTTAFIELLREGAARKRYVRGKCTFPHAVQIQTDETF